MTNNFATRQVKRKYTSRTLFSTELFHALTKILRPDEYISHLAALFIQGLLTKPPPTITIVSSHRRRKRNFEGCHLRFVSHSKSRPTSTRNISCQNNTIRVATPEMAFVDLLSDMNEAPDLDELIALTAKLPFSVKSCLNLASGISNTVFKRAVFLLAFCGRLSNPRIPFSQLSKSPAILDPRVPKNEARSWDRRFACFFPTRLLDKKVEAMKPISHSALNDWLIIRNSPSFIATQKKNGHLIIRGTLNITEFKAVWEKTSTILHEQNLVQWARWGGLFPIPSLEKTRRRKIVHKWIFMFNSAQTIHAIKNMLCSQAFISELSPHTLDLALHLAILLEDEHIFLDIVAVSGEKLVDFVSFRSFQIGVSLLLSKQIALPTIPGCLLARAMTIGGDLAKASAILKLTKVAQASSPDWPWQCLARGMILLRLNRWKAAQRLLIIAKRIWRTKVENYGLARAENALGNLCLALAKIAAARKHYLSALSFNCKIESPSQLFQAGILFNLSITYLHLGQRKQATTLLRHAMVCGEKNDNFVVISRCLFILSQISFYNGELQHSLTYLYRCIILRKYLKDRHGTIETMGLLSWIYLLKGHLKTASYWEKSISAKGNLELALQNMVCGRNLLLQCRISEASRYLNIAREQARSAKAAILMQSRLEILAAIAERHLGRERVSPPMKIVDKVISRNPHLDEVAWFALVRAVYSPTDFTVGEVKRSLKQALATKRFDPFWFLLAKDLLSTKLSEANCYIYQQDKLSPSALKITARAFLTLKNSFESKVVLAKVESKQEILLLQSDIPNTQQVDMQRYLAAKASSSHTGGVLEIDFVHGVACFSPCQVNFNPSSLPAKILAMLFQVFPTPMAVEHLYKTIWNAEYYEDHDLPTVKTTLSRIRQILGQICPAARLLLTMESTPLPLVQLHLPVKWRAWIPENLL